MALSFVGRRPQVPAVLLAVLVAIGVLATANDTFWRHSAQAFGGNYNLFAFGGAVVLLFAAALVLVAYPYLLKAIAVLAFALAAPAAYFTDTFGTIINSSMIENAATTTVTEARYLVTFDLVWHLVLYALVPICLVLWVRISPVPFFRRLVQNVAVAALFLILSAGLIYSELGVIIISLRQDRVIVETLNPTGPVSSAIKYAARAAADAKAEMAPLGLDAKRGAWISASRKPVVLVVVAGETARAANFSLNGYERETNPELSKLDIVNYPNVSSCGTDTAESLPCMFSNLDREDYSKSKAWASESLMNVATHAGIEAVWWDNNTGDKGIARGISYESLTHAKEPEHCKDNECRDSVFLSRLEKLVSAASKDTLVVLHQIGSHGPAYYMRYPDDLRRFVPDCRTPQITSCSHEEVVNAYDNSILATDRFLADVISILKKHQASVDGAIYYASDHGESLGENGLFLHGTPYSMAPEVQTHVPMIAWFSETYRSRSGLDRDCLLKRTAEAYSHDNFFHSILGLLDIQTSVYNPGLDMFKDCRNK
jgi:lipid A ethanolaminephosphotransferase